MPCVLRVFLSTSTWTMMFHKWHDLQNQFWGKTRSVSLNLSSQFELLQCRTRCFEGVELPLPSRASSLDSPFHNGWLAWWPESGLKRVLLVLEAENFRSKTSYRYLSVEWDGPSSYRIVMQSLTHCNRRGIGLRESEDEGEEQKQQQHFELPWW